MTKFAIKGWNPSKLQTVITIKKVSQKSGQTYETGYFFNCLLEFTLMTNGISINAFIKTKENTSKSLFLHYYNKSGLANYKKQGTFDAEIAKVILTEYFENIQNTKERVKAA